MNKRILSGLSLIALLGAGCNPLQSVQDKITQKVSDKVAEGVVSGMTGGKVKVDTDSNTLSMTDEKTGQSVSFGENVKVPDDFPKDVPVYAKAAIIGVFSSKKTDDGSSLTLTTTDASEDVAAWYDKTLVDAGWTQDISYKTFDLITRTYSKGSLKLSFTANTSEGKTTISLIRSQESQ